LPHFVPSTSPKISFFPLTFFFPLERCRPSPPCKRSPTGFSLFPPPESGRKQASSLDDPLLIERFFVFPEPVCFPPSWVAGAFFFPPFPEKVEHTSFSFPVGGPRCQGQLSPGCTTSTYPTMQHCVLWFLGEFFFFLVKRRKWFQHLVFQSLPPCGLFAFCSSSLSSVGGVSHDFRSFFPHSLVGWRPFSSVVDPRHLLFLREQARLMADLFWASSSLILLPPQPSRFDEPVHLLGHMFSFGYRNVADLPQGREVF